mgnify:CR=1 FL=1
MSANKILKKSKINNNLYYKNKSKEDIVNLLNNNLPINLKNISYIVDQIYDQYPLISKPEISYIVKNIIYSFRDNLVKSNIININNFFYDYKLYFYSFNKNNKIYNAIRAKIKTSPRIKYENVK